MDNLSVKEFEELGAKIGKMVQDKFGDSEKVSDERMKKMTEDITRDIMRKSNAHGTPWQQSIPPDDVIEIEKALYSDASKDENIKKFQDWNDDLYLLCTLAKKAPYQLTSYKMFEKKYSELSKALNTSTAGVGEEWIPTGFSNTMLQAIELEAKVASQFYKFNMPTNPYTFPILLTDGTAYLGGEATTDSPSMYTTSTPTTDNVSFTAKKIVANYPVSDEMQEDSAVAAIPMLKKSIPKAVAKAKDNAIINGDTTSTHFDTGYTVDSEDARRAWMGLRRTASDANATLSLKIDGSGWTSAATGLAIWRTPIEDMGVYGVTMSDLVCFCNTNVYGKLRAITEVSTNDKFGTNATIHNGVLKALDGIDIVLSQHVEESQNSSGIYDGSTTTDTQFIIAHKPSFWQGVRTNFTIELVRKPLYGLDYLVATTRCVWKPVFDTTAEQCVAWVYNITK